MLRLFPMAEQPSLARKEITDDFAFKREVGRVVDGISQSGRVDWISDFVLPNGGAGPQTLVVPDRRVTSDCHVSLQATTDAAAIILTAVWIPPSEYVPETDTSDGSFTVHYPALVADAAFRYCIKG